LSRRALTDLDTFDADFDAARCGVADTGEVGKPPTDDDTYQLVLHLIAVLLFPCDLSLLGRSRGFFPNEVRID
jgi:hypothetical protein